MSRQAKNALIVPPEAWILVTMLYEYAPEIDLAVNFVRIEPQCP